MADPITLGLLGVSAAAEAGRTISGLIPSEYDRLNKEEIERLQRLKEKGGLGLSPAEQQQMTEQQLAPVRSATEQLQGRQEALAAATGQQSGAMMQQLRRSSASTVGDAVQRAAQNIQAEDLRKAQAQRAELEQRQAVREQRRRDRVQSAWLGIQQSAEAAGKLVGAVPEVLNSTGAFGARVASPEGLQAAMDKYGIPMDTQNYLMSLAPRDSRALLEGAIQNNPDPRAQALRSILLRSAQSGAAAQAGWDPRAATGPVARYDGFVG